MRQMLRSGVSGIFSLIVAVCLALGLAGCGGGGGGGTTSATLSSIAITPASATVALGATASLTATGTYSNGLVADITAQVTWTSATPATASVGANTGVVTGVAVNSTTVTAALSGVTSPAANITVTNATLSSIAITPATTSIAKGTTATFTATGTYSDGTTGNISGSVNWWSSGSAATINASGIATGTAVGSSSISASLNGITSNSATLTVTAATLSSIAITPASASVAKGATASLTATGTYSDGSTADITSQATWTSATPATASVGANTGIVTGVAWGTSTITASLNGINSPGVTLSVIYDFYVDAVIGNDVTGSYNCATYPLPSYWSYWPNVGDGTAAHPFKTIACALTAASAKVTNTGTAVGIKVLPGLYNVANGETFPITIPDKVSLYGDAANKGAGGTATEINGVGSTGITYATLSQSSTIFIPATSSNITISGLKIVTPSTVGGQTNGILVNGSANITIADSTISPVAGINGITALPDATVNITGNNIEVGGGGIAVGAEGAATSVKLRGNSINTVATGGYGVMTAVTFPVIDLGTAADPGNNILCTAGGALYGLALGINPSSPTTINAVGNTWKANIATGVAVTDSQGQMTVPSVTGAYTDANLGSATGVTINLQ